MSSEQQDARVRHGVVSRVHEEFARAQRYALSFSVVLLDLDETEARDELGALLRRELRQPDFVAPYSDAEFAVILPETAPDGARQSVARVRNRLAERQRLSAGIASYPHPAVTQPDDLFTLAEAALKRGKAQTGERIAVAP